MIRLAKYLLDNSFVNFDTIYFRITIDSEKAL